MRRPSTLPLVVLILLLVSCKGDEARPTATDESPELLTPAGEVESAGQVESTAEVSPPEEGESAPQSDSGVGREPAAATPSAPPTNEPEIEAAGADLPPSTLFETAWDDRSLFQAGLIPSEQSLLEQEPGASIYHMELTLSDDLRTVSGLQEVRYTNLEGVPLEMIYFHLFPNILGGRSEVSGVTVNSVAVDAEYTAARSVLGVPLERPLQPGEQIVLRLEFQVEVPTQGGSNYGVFAVIDGVLALAHFYPHLSVYDDEGWNIALPSENADVTYADAAYYLVRVTAPVEQIIVASGIEVERQTAGDRQTLTLAAGPARDFYLAASADYSVISRDVGQTTVNSYGFAQFREAMEQALSVAANALQSFNRRLGEYPYTEFDLAPTPNLALGVEYPGAVVIRSALYDPEATLRDTPASFFLESTVAHEVGHQWFYNTIGNDQLDEPWLDESLVQYLTFLYFVDTYGADAGTIFRSSFLSRWDVVGRDEKPIGLPVGDYEGAEYGAIVYGRGPLFFEALAETMGEEVFAAFLREHYQSNKFGIATGEGIRKLAEEHCGCDLDPLFAEWVYGP